MPDEVPDTPTHVSLHADGVLHLRGDLEVATPYGPRHETRVMLCGCGARRQHAVLRPQRALRRTRLRRPDPGEGERSRTGRCAARRTGESSRGIYLYLVPFIPDASPPDPDTPL